MNCSSPHSALLVLLWLCNVWPQPPSTFSSSDTEIPAFLVPPHKGAPAPSIFLASLFYFYNFTMAFLSTLWSTQEVEPLQFSTEVKCFFCLVLHLHPDVQYLVRFFGWRCTLTQWFNFFIAGPISIISSYLVHPNESSKSEIWTRANSTITSSSKENNELKISK